MFDLTGKTALVTGATGGIGGAIARALHAQGATVAISGRQVDKLEALKAELGDRAVVCPCDLADKGQVAKLIDEAVKALGGRLDILVNNAGVNSFVHRVTLDAFPAEEWERVTRIDLDGLYRMSHAALQPMVQQGEGGRIINIASVVGLAAMRLQSAFVAAKAGIIHLTRSMALELGPQGILTNAIAPGSIMSEGTRSLFYGADGKFAGRTEEFMRHLPLGRPGTAEEIAEAVLFLASPNAAYVNGQVLAVDGGWTAGYML